MCVPDYKRECVCVQGREIERERERERTTCMCCVREGTQKLGQRRQGHRGKRKKEQENLQKKTHTLSLQIHFIDRHPTDVLSVGLKMPTCLKHI